MSKIGKKASVKEREEQTKASVYDFIYYDSRRIGSFLAQFENAGHLQQIIQKEAVEQNESAGFKMNVGGGATIAGTGGQGSVGFEKSPGASGSEASERVYDPLWSNARGFLDYLAENGLINEDLVKANIGQFVLCSGTVQMVDLKLLSKVWELKAVKKLINSGANQDLNRHQRRAQKKTGTSSNNDDTELFFDMMKVLPHTTQLRLKTDSNDNVWCSLIEENLSMSTSDMVLKHGISLSGTWHLLGVLDAQPQSQLNNEQFKSDEVFDESGEGLGSAMFSLIAPIAQNILGKPAGSFGLTPLLMFRSVSD